MRFAAILIALAACTQSSSNAPHATGGAAPTPGQLVPFADFEAGLATSFNTKMQAGDDRPAGGVSSSKIEIIDGGANGTAHALRVTGNSHVDTWPYPYAGVAFALGQVVENAAATVDMRNYKGIQFWVRGDGKHYMVRFHTSAVEDFDFHYFDFDATKDWHLVREPFSALKQFDWGQKVPWSQAAEKVSLAFFMIYCPPGENFGDFQFDLDEIALF